jgi:hypothetical protein
MPDRGLNERMRLQMQENEARDGKEASQLGSRQQPFDFFHKMVRAFLF